MKGNFNTKEDDELVQIIKNLIRIGKVDIKLTKGLLKSNNEF